MRKSRNLAVMMTAAVLAVGLAACEKKGPAERAGEEVDQALGTQEKGPAEKTGEALDNAAGEIKQETNEAAQKVENAADELKK